MTATLTYLVPDMHCSHCTAAVAEELAKVHGVISVDVELDSKRVVVSGDELVDARLRAAIAEAGYEAV